MSVVMVATCVRKNPERFQFEQFHKEFDTIDSNVVEDLIVVDSFSSTITPSNNDVKVDTPILLNPNRKAIIEITGKRLRSFVIDIDTFSNWKLIYHKIGEDDVFEKLRAIEDVNREVQKHLLLISEYTKTSHVDFVVKPRSLEYPKVPLVIEGIYGMGYKVKEVGLEDEAKYALAAILPKQYKENSYIVDINEERTKISWYLGTTLITEETYGHSYHKSGTSEHHVVESLEGIISRIPETLRTNCFIIGEVPTKLASLHKVEGRVFQLLLAPEDYQANSDDLLCGLNIYKTIYDISSTSKGRTSFIYRWNVTYALGYLLENK